MFSLLASKDPSQDVGSFCTEHGLAKANYYYWFKKYKVQNNAVVEKTNRFVPIDVNAKMDTPLVSLELASGHVVHAFHPDAFSFLATLLK